MARNDRPAWTAAENELLRLHYPTTELADLPPLFPGRNPNGIRQQASRLHLLNVKPKPGAWSDAHMAILREHYPTKGAAYVAALVGRSVNRVIGHAHEYGIPFVGIRNPKRNVPKQYPAKKAVSRPKKPLVEAKAPAPPVVKPAPRKPAKPPVSAPPVKASPGTPLLNARAAQKRQKQKEQAEKPKPFVTAQQLRELRADHPARWAYTKEAHRGPAAATAAFYAAMQQQP